MDLNHRPLGYEDNGLKDSIAFQGLDAAGNDRESLKGHQSTVIGPQSDHTLRLSNFRPSADPILKLLSAPAVSPRFEVLAPTLTSHRSWLRKVLAGTTIGR